MTLKLRVWVQSCFDSFERSLQAHRGILDNSKAFPKSVSRKDPLQHNLGFLLNTWLKQNDLQLVLVCFRPPTAYLPGSDGAACLADTVWRCAWWMSWCPEVLFVLLLSWTYRDLAAWIKTWTSPQPHRNTNMLWPQSTWSNIMRRLCINKHFEIAPVASTAIRGGPPTKRCSDTKTTQLENRNAWVEKRKGLSGREGWHLGGMEELGNKWFDAETEQWPFDSLEDYMHCDFQGMFALKCCRTWKDPQMWQLFLSFCRFVVQKWPGPRDTYITGPWQLHTYMNTARRVLAPSLLSPGPGPLISLAAEGQ